MYKNFYVNKVWFDFLKKESIDGKKELHSFLELWTSIKFLNDELVKNGSFKICEMIFELVHVENELS